MSEKNGPSASNSEDNTVDKDYEFQIKPSPSRSISTSSATSQSAKQRVYENVLLHETTDANTNEKPVLDPFKDIMKESELLVKIADLGNACWTVRLNLFINQT